MTQSSKYDLALSWWAGNREKGATRCRASLSRRDSVLGVVIDLQLVNQQSCVAPPKPVQERLGPKLLRSSSPVIVKTSGFSYLFPFLIEDPYLNSS